MRCRECQEQFDAPYVYYETHGFHEPPYEEWQVCPYCGSPDWVGSIDGEELEFDEEVEEWFTS